MNGKQIGERLCWVVVPSVASVNDRNWRFHRRGQRCAFFGMTHNDYIRVTCSGAHCVSHAFALGGGRRRCICETNNTAAKFNHCGLKAEAGARAGLVEKRGERFISQRVAKGSLIRVDSFRDADEAGNLVFSEVVDCV